MCVGLLEFVNLLCAGGGVCAVLCTGDGALGVGLHHMAKFTPLCVVWC